MDRSYWEKIAPGYNTEIFDVLQNDRKKLIIKAIKAHAAKNKTIIDLGCAIGKWLPVISPLFKKVYAVDISSENLKIAKQLHPSLQNIIYRRCDLSSSSARLESCDVAICINAILTDSLNKRTRFFSNLQKAVKKNGVLIMVLPSLESYLLSSVIRQRWDPDNNASSFINDTEKNRQFQNLLGGNAEIDDVPTKHYLKEELELLLNLDGFSLQQTKKIKYGWKTEFFNPPAWLTEPSPWDWLVIAKKK